MKVDGTNYERMELILLNQSIKNIEPFYFDWILLHILEIGCVVYGYFCHTSTFVSSKSRLSIVRTMTICRLTMLNFLLKYYHTLDRVQFDEGKRKRGRERDYHFEWAAGERNRKRTQF